MIDPVLEFSPFEHSFESLLVTRVSFDFTTAAVVSFVLVILGLAAALLLMIRFANPRVHREGE